MLGEPSDRCRAGSAALDGDAHQTSEGALRRSTNDPQFLDGADQGTYSPPGSPRARNRSTMASATGTSGNFSNQGRSVATTAFSCSASVGRPGRGRSRMPLPRVQQSERRTPAQGFAGRPVGGGQTLRGSVDPCGDRSKHDPHLQRRALGVEATGRAATAAHGLPFSH
jgi:hypothetical protein